MSSPIKIAFGSIPKDGGTFTFYRNLRPALKPYGIDLRCVTVGQREHDLVEEAYVDEGCVLLAPEIGSVKKQAQVFSDWCDREEIDIVMAINSVAMLSALPYLSKRVRVLSRCANGFGEGYRVTLSGRSRLTSIVALTPRLKDDLVRDYAVAPQMIHLIPNGVDPAAFESAAARVRALPNDRPVQLGFVGRLEHRQKGVLYLPEIVKELKALETSFRLRIVGKGVHRAVLERELRPYINSGEVEFLGAMPKDEVPNFLKATDIFLFTSHFEGCPNALLEAMMAGCVPIALLIEGITDFLIDSGRTGFVSPMADCASVAQQITQLAVDRAFLRRMSDAAAAEARDRFTSEAAATRYAQLFQAVMEAEPSTFEPLPWSQFRVDPVYQKRFTGYLPKAIKEPIKAAIRNPIVASYLQRLSMSASARVYSTRE